MKLNPGAILLKTYVILNLWRDEVKQVHVVSQSSFKTWTCVWPGLKTKYRRHSFLLVTGLMRVSPVCELRHRKTDRRRRGWRDGKKGMEFVQWMRGR